MRSADASIANAQVAAKIWGVPEQAWLSAAPECKAAVGEPAQGAVTVQNSEIVDFTAPAENAAAAADM